MSKIITKESLTALRIWEPPSLDNVAFVPEHRATPAFMPATFTPPPPPAPVESPPSEPSPAPIEELPTLSLPTAEEIEAISRAAYEEGFAQGQQEGMAQGIARGHQEGLAKGLAEGQQQGMAQGKQEGLAQGLEEGRREGRAQGLEQGKQEGLANGEADVQARLKRLQQLISLLNRPLASVGAEVEEQLVALAMAVARQVVRRELRLYSDEIVPIVREALTHLPANHRNLRISLHPSDVPLVRAAFGTEEGEAGLRLMEDATLTPGGCRVETDASYVDATVEQRMERVLAHLLEGQENGEKGNGV